MPAPEHRMIVLLPPHPVAQQLTSSSSSGPSFTYTDCMFSSRLATFVVPVSTVVETTRHQLRTNWSSCIQSIQCQNTSLSLEDYLSIKTTFITYQNIEMVIKVIETSQPHGVSHHRLLDYGGLERPIPGMGATSSP